MNVSAAVKALLQEKFQLPATATDAEAKTLLDAKLASKELTIDDILGAETKANQNGNSKLDALIAERVATETAKAIAEIKAAVPAPTAPADGSLDSLVTPKDVFLGRRASHPNVKLAIDSYSGAKSNLVYTKYHKSDKDHALAGQPMLDDTGRQLESTSERQKAFIGAFFKWRMQSTIPPHAMPRALKMTDHDWDLVNWGARNEKWVGELHVDGGVRELKGRLLNDMEVKALLNETGTGSYGNYTVPLVYDDAVIQTSILTGELFPFVNCINLSRGNSVHAYSMVRPTLQENVAEGTAITLFNTASFFGTLDTTIYTACGAMTFGLDWQADTPVDVASLVIQEFADAAAAYLDNAVAIGDGTGQMTGIFTASGTQAVPSSIGPTGPWTAGDLQSLYFGLNKAERNRKPSYLCYVGNDNTWKRLKQITVGPNDARRLFNTNGVNSALGSLGTYQIMDVPYKVAIGCTDTQLAFGNLKRYRAYRRLGGSFKYEERGQTLMLSNLGLIVFRMRYGGQPELGAAFAIMSNGTAQ